MRRYSLPDLPIVVRLLEDALDKGMGMRLSTDLWFVSVLIAFAAPVEAKATNQVQVGSSNRAIGSIKQCISDAGGLYFSVSFKPSPYFGSSIMLLKKDGEGNVQTTTFVLENFSGSNKVFRKLSYGPEETVAGATQLARDCLSSVDPHR